MRDIPEMLPLDLLADESERRAQRRRGKRRAPLADFVGVLGRPGRQAGREAWREYGARLSDVLTDLREHLQGDERWAERYRPPKLPGDQATWAALQHYARACEVVIRRLELVVGGARPVGTTLRAGVPQEQRAERLKAIVGMLRGPEALTMRDLAKAFEVSAPQISKDLCALQEQGVVFEVTPKGAARGMRIVSDQRPPVVEVKEDYGFEGLAPAASLDDLCAQYVLSPRVEQTFRAMFVARAPQRGPDLHRAIYGDEADSPAPHKVTDAIRRLRVALAGTPYAIPAGGPRGYIMTGPRRFAGEGGDGLS